MEDSSHMSESVIDSDDEERVYSRSNDEKTPLSKRKSKQCSEITPWLVITTLVCIFGSSFQFGYNIGVINAPEKVIRHSFEIHNVTMTDFVWSTAVSITAVGGLIGAVAGPVVADMFGRKSTLIWNNVIIIIGCVFVFLSHSATSRALLIIGRFVIGLNNGANTVVVPLYLSEISPTKFRGSIGILNQFGIVVGMLLSYILGLQEILGNSSGWPYLMSFSFVIAVFQFMILPCCPSSPRYLLIKLNKEFLARQELRKFQGTYNIEEVISEMKLEKESETKEGTLTVLQLLKSKPLRFSLALCALLHISQQLSGINAIMYYSSLTFERAEISEPDVATCGIGVVSLIMVGISVLLIDRAGRRTLMLLGLGGMFVFYGLTTIGYALEDEHDNMKYLSVVCTFIVIAFFQIGPGGIPWFMIPELFSQGPRPAASSIGGAINWLSNFIIGVTFPAIQKLLFPYVFIVFMVIIAIFWTLLYKYLPETKGKTFEQISRRLRGSIDHSVNCDNENLNEDS